MNTIDARGRSCPEPVIMTKNALDKNPNANLEIMVDTHVAVENIKRFVENKGYSVKLTELGEDYKLNISK